MQQNEEHNGLGALFGPDNIEVEARQLIENARRSEYGQVQDSFARIAHAWTGIIGRPVSAQDVASCMVALKLIRESNRPKRDNRVDAVGYVLLLDQLQEE